MTKRLESKKHVGTQYSIDTRWKDQMDSSVEIGESGQPLNNSNEETQTINDNGNYPRINTTNL